MPLAVYIHIPFSDFVSIEMQRNQKLTAESLPVVHCRGTHYEVGYCIGHTFSKRINDWFADPISPMEHFRRFRDDPLGGKCIARYLETAEKCFPEYVREMRGIADGSGAAYEDIALQNLLTEIYFAHSDITDRIGNTPPSGKMQKELAGCTSIYVNRNGARLLAHNEDGGDGSERYNFLAQVKIVDESDRSLVKENFITFMYPGMIPGFAYNVAGDYVITVNTLVPKAHCHTGVPTSFVIRKMLACKSMEEMVEAVKCKPYGCAYGFNLNIASVKGSDMLSLEVCPGENGTEIYLHKVAMVPDDADICHYFHQNFYKNVKVEELPSCEGTLARGRRCDEMPAPRDIEGIRTILGDVENKKFPIFRGVVDEKITCKTVSTALFNITDKKAYFFLDNPKYNDAFVTMVFP